MTQPRYRLYIRRSDDDQSTHSPAAQEREGRRYIADSGGALVDIYVDDDLSGRRADRPDLQRLIADATADPGSIVLVHKYDRLARDTETALRIIYRELKPRRVKVESVMERGIDPWTPLGKSVVTMSYSIATYFSDNLATEVVKGLTEKWEKGGVVGPVSYGYRWHYDRDANGAPLRATAALRPTEDAATVVALFTHYATGNVSDRELATLANRQGWTFCARGSTERRPFTSDTIGGLLANRVYVGIATLHGQERPGSHPAIIDENLWAAVAGIRARRARQRSSGRRRDGTRALLAELASCAICGGTMAITTSGNHAARNRYYRCARRRHLGTDGCTARQVRAGDVEQLLLRALQGYAVVPALREAVLAAARARLRSPVRSAAPPERSAAAITRAISRLGERYQWGDIERDDYLRERAALHAELAAAGELPSVDTPQMLDVTRAIALLDNIGELLAAGSSEAQRTLVHQLIDRVWLHENTIAGIRPTAAFALLTHPAMAVVCVTSTGLEPVTFSSGG